MFPLIYFSVGKYAGLQVDLLVLPRKGDFGSARCKCQAWAVMKAAAGPRMNGSG